MSQSPVESLDSYVKVFWLDTVPRESGCSCAAWTIPESDTQEPAREHWLSVARPERPEPPPVADEARDKQCPNFSCKRDDLVAKVCGHLGIITRGKPREQLKRKIAWAVSHLKKHAAIEEHRAKNVRVRLLHPSRQESLF